jgi:hypothetical protein
MHNGDVYLGTDRNCLSLAQLAISRSTELDTYTSYNTGGYAAVSEILATPSQLLILSFGQQRPDLKNPTGDISIPVSNPSRILAEKLLSSSTMAQRQELRQAVYALLMLTVEDVAVAVPATAPDDSLKRLQEHAIRLLQQLPSDHLLLAAFEEATVATMETSQTASEAASLSAQMDALHLQDEAPPTLHALVHAPVRLPVRATAADATFDTQTDTVLLAQKINAKTRATSSLIKYRLEVLEVLLSPAYVCSQEDSMLRHNARSGFITHGGVDLMAQLTQVRLLSLL